MNTNIYFEYKAIIGKVIAINNFKITNLNLAHQLLFSTSHYPSFSFVIMSVFTE